MENSLICVAESDSQLLGVAQLQVDDEEAFLARLFVSPARQKAGIGKALFGWSIKAARQEGSVDSVTVPGLRMPRFRVTLSTCPSTHSF